jgi:ABC-type Mn2+/Zn2+ transport system permease subunit
MFDALSLPFMQMALAAGLLVGCTCAYLGVYLILKRVVFVGIALSEIAAAGLALGLMAGARLGLSGDGALGLAQLMSFLLTAVGIVFFWLPWAERRVSKESLIGYAYAGAAAVAVLVVAKNPGGALSDLDLLSGDLLFIAASDLVTIAAVTAVVWVLHLGLRREFLFVSLDRETATTQGLPSHLYDFLLYLSVGAVIAVAMRRVGVLFVFASLVAPALTGLLFARRLLGVTLVAIASAAIGVTLGLVASFQFDLPTGSTVVVAYALLALAGAAYRLARS